MNPDAAKTIPEGYLGKQSHAEAVRETYREQGRQEERQRMLNLLLHQMPIHLHDRIEKLIKGEQK